MTNALIGRILLAEPKKLASIVKSKTGRAQGIAVDFVGDHLKDKKVTEFNTLDKLLSEDLGLPQKRKSKSSTSGEKPKSAKTPTAEPESQASVLRT